MKVTLICDVLGEENNGTTIAAMNLLRSLKAKGHEVRVVCPDEKRRGQPGFYVVPTYNFGIFNNYVKKNGVTLAKPEKDVLQEAIRGADIVHVLVPFGLGKAGSRMAQEMGIPVSASFHCQAENITNHIFLMNANLINKLAYHIFNRRLYRNCDAVHYPTQFICDVFEREVGKTNHYIISNGVNSAFCPGPGEKPPAFADKFVVLSIGRYSREKAQHILIDAVAQSRHRDKIQLILAGSGPRREFLEKRAKKAGILPPVFGFYSRQELVQVIRQADLYVHPAVIEIEAIACLEAIACGLPPVIADSPRSATRNFALSEDNLFHYNNAEDLAKKIDYWLENPEERQKCSQNYVGYAKEFAFDRCMDRMEAMLLETAGKQ